MASIPLAEQIEEVAKTVRDRQRSWLDEGRRGRMLEETAVRKTEQLRAAEATLRWLERNMGWIKCEAEARRLRDLHEAEQAADAARKVAPTDDWDAPGADPDDDDTDDGLDIAADVDLPPDMPAGPPTAADLDHPTMHAMRAAFPDAEVLGAGPLTPLQQEA